MAAGGWNPRMRRLPSAAAISTAPGAAACDQRQQPRRDAPADELVGVRLAGDEDAVAVGDRQRAALREVALAQPGAEPGEVDAGDHHERPPADFGPERHRQVGGLVGPAAGVLADHEGGRSAAPRRTTAAPARPSGPKASPAEQRTVPSGSATAKPRRCGRRAATSSR